MVFLSENNRSSLLAIFKQVTVANSKSALKRIQIAERNRLRNKSYKSAVRTLMKKTFAIAEQYQANPDETTLAQLQATLSATYSKIDKAVKRNVFHVNNAAHKKSRLAKAFKRATTPA